MKRFFMRLFFALFVPFLILCLWTLYTDVAQSIYWPSPLVIAQVFPETWFGGRLVNDVVPSLIRLIAGYGAAILLGVLAGLLIGSFRRVRLFTEPVFELFRAIPPPVLLPIFMLFLGIGDNMRITVIAFGCIWPILINTIEGVRGIDSVQRDTVRSYGISRRRVITKLILPAAAPQIFVGARQALSIGLIMVVISEMFAARNGIGFNVIQFQRLYALPEMWSGIIILGLIGVLANAVFKRVEKRAMTWYFGMQLTGK